MTAVQKNKGRKLAVLRIAGAIMIIACVNYAYTGYVTGVIEVGTRRNSLIMTGENLWLGYMFLLASTAISTLLLFINKSQTKSFNNYAKVFGGIWFVTFGACIVANLSSR